MRPTRRDFLGACAALPMFTFRGETASDRRCIFLWLTGGPSHVDTFDPKPDAPAEIRGPFRPIVTRVPGLHVTELLPQIADRADRIAIIRTMHHDEAPIHEAGQQLLQTGRFCREQEQPHIGATLSALGLGPWSILPGPLGDTGVDLSHGQGAGTLGKACEPRYGGRPGLFHTNCLAAVQRIESGERFVVVNSHTTVYDGESWDCHADGGRLNTTIEDYRVIAPLFDVAFSAVLDQLELRGLLGSTLVVAAGEFGRTPFINSRGGRDHWPGAWTVLLAGAGICGGAVVGKTDKLGGEPVDRPVSPAEFVATIYHALGVDPRPVTGCEPIGELS